MSPDRRYRPVPLHRRWISDIAHFGKKAHIFGCNWRINIGPAVAARAARQPLIGWTAMWMKALALVSRRRPELRTAYLPFPWARLYVHPECICTVAIDRTWRGVSAVFFEQCAQPDMMALADLDARLRELRRLPFEEVGGFRRLIRYARPPVIVRRLLWGSILYWSGRRRARLFGTCALNPYPTRGVVTQSATPLSFLLYYGLVEPDGDTLVQVFFDHRVMDGIEVYRLIRDIEATMNRDIAAELRGELASPPDSQ